MNKILILGGTGAMGSYLVSHLSKQYDCYVTTRQQLVSKSPNIHYIQGNAHEETFLFKLLDKEWYAIIDFMIYTTADFKKLINRFLGATSQYVYISSARVYSNVDSVITEQSPRLIDSCTDDVYLSTDEYALAKGRQENMLFNSGNNNWTIIRPYITYSDYRLQLGPMEKEHWLYRALQGRPIVMPRDISEKTTTLTFGNDVASGIASIIGKDDAKGQAFHITCPHSLKWKDVAEIYSDALSSIVKCRVPICYVDRWTKRLGGGMYQVKYDRLYDRQFDSSKIAKFVDVNSFIPVTDGLTHCLRNFCNHPSFHPISFASEGYKDRLCLCRTPFGEIRDIKNKIKYFLTRYIIK